MGSVVRILKTSLPSNLWVDHGGCGGKGILDLACDISAFQSNASQICPSGHVFCPSNDLIVLGVLSPICINASQYLGFSLAFVLEDTGMWEIAAFVSRISNIKPGGLDLRALKCGRALVNKIKYGIRGSCAISTSAWF